ncbi:MAG: hypothetical protein JNJ88_08780 [Planctomycetes bacterium]|nr:hypothetical protein [Planctomycetota bacterium]
MTRAADPMPAGFLAAARAPLRIDLAGGFTDVPPFCERAGGFVVNLAISLEAAALVLELGRRERSRHPWPCAVSLALRGRRLLSGIERGRDRIDPADPLAPFRAALRDARAEGLALAVACEGPAASGLGSSGTMLVAALAALDAARGTKRTPAELARRARELEVEELGLLGGGQDPIAAAFGGLQAIEFGPGRGARGRNGRPRALQPTEAFRAWLTRALVLADLRTPRASSVRIERVVDRIRRAESHAVATLLVMRDHARSLADAIERSDRAAFGKSFAAHGRALARLEPTLLEGGVAEALAAAEEAGALGAKPCGAGGGGCVVALAPPARRGAVERALVRRGAKILQVQFSERGVSAWSHTTNP